MAKRPEWYTIQTHDGRRWSARATRFVALASGELVLLDGARIVLLFERWQRVWLNSHVSEGARG